MASRFHVAAMCSAGLVVFHVHMSTPVRTHMHKLHFYCAFLMCTILFTVILIDLAVADFFCLPPLMPHVEGPSGPSTAETQELRSCARCWLPHPRPLVPIPEAVIRLPLIIDSYASN